MRALDRFWVIVLVMPPLLALLALPAFGQRIVVLIGIYALLGVGYQLTFGQLGVLNLAQGAFFGLGAYATAFAAPTMGSFAFLVALLGAAIPAALVAALTLRLQSHYFALATLALASLVSLVAVNAETLTGGANGLVGFATTLPRGRSLLVLVWVCLIAAILLQARVFSGPLGEQASLLRQAPLAAATLGIDAGRFRISAFVLGGGLAGLAGAFSASLSGVVSPEAAGFPLMVLCLSLVVLGGARHPMGAVIGAILAVCLPELLRDLQGTWLLGYAIATLVVVRWAPSGLSSLIDQLRNVDQPRRPSPLLPATAPPMSPAKRLTLRHVVKRFGGVDALQDVSVTVVRGEIVGLIGPNGSGKTTLLNVVSGLERADGGNILLDDTHLENLPPHRIARAGLARSFQSVMREGDTKTGDLARALSRAAPFLLIDEPATGMGERDRRQLGELLRQLRSQTYGILIVDHDIELLSAVCDRLICLDGGRVIAEGSPAAVRADRRVRASFLGLADAA
jgi:branched-chain amino acid transport system permease protein